MKVENGLYVLPTDDLARAKGCYLDFALADRIIAFAEKCCTIQTDDFSGRAGRPVKLIEWQRVLIRTLFSWKNASGDLRFSYASVWLGRRQGKSLLCSIIATFFMLSSRRCKVPLIASSIEEAKAVYDRCHDFVTCSPMLAKRCKPTPSHYTIKDTEGLGEIKILSSEKTGKLGKGVQCLILDEIAAWNPHSARDVFNSLHDSLKDKVNAVTISISTPQHDLSSLGREKFLAAEAVLKGEGEEKSKDITLLPVIYEAPENFRDDIVSALHAALPSLNITTPLHKYVEEWEAVKDTVDEPRFTIMNLGRWVSSCTTWIPNVFWEACREKFDESQFYGGKYDSISVAADWGASYDLTCYTIIIEKNGLFYLLPRYFIPTLIAQDRQSKDKIPYLTYANMPSNKLFLTDGNTVDATKVLAELKNDRAKFNFHEVRFDPTKLALVSQLFQAQGFQCVDVKTNANTMSPAFQKFETLIRERKIRHDDNAISNWCLGNCKPKKEPTLMVVKSGELNKIDFVDSVAIGLTKWLSGSTSVPVLPQGQSWAFTL
jgi:phage terminase large subunit-like protein